MKHSFASLPCPCGRAGRPDRWSRHGSRSSASGHGSPLRHCARRLAPAVRPSRSLRLEALHRRPGLDQRAVDREVLVDRSFFTLGCASTAAGTSPRCRLPAAGRGSSRTPMVPDGIVDADADKPAEQQVVFQPLHQKPLKPRRRSRSPRSPRLRNPGQLRRGERYRQNPPLKGVKIGRRYGVKFERRLTGASECSSQPPSKRCCDDRLNSPSRNGAMVLIYGLATEKPQIGSQAGSRLFAPDLDDDNAVGISWGLFARAANVSASARPDRSTIAAPPMNSGAHRRRDHIRFAYFARAANAAGRVSMFTRPAAAGERGDRRCDKCSLKGRNVRWCGMGSA